MSMSSQWLDNFVGEVRATGTIEALAFVESNYLPLANLGLDGTNQVLQLFIAGKDTEAMLILDANLGPDDIIAAENKNAADLNAKIAAREKFISELKSFAWALAPIVLKLALGAVSGGTAL